MNELLITQDGLALLTEELERLRTEGRRAAAERIRVAVSTDLDLNANADYQAAREEQALLEQRIARLEALLVDAEVSGPDAGNDVIDLGERVRLRDLETGRRLEYEVVGSFEADPAAGRISAASPLGRALMGRRRGDVALVEAPKGRRRLRIVSVTQPAGST